MHPEMRTKMIPGGWLNLYSLWWEPGHHDHLVCMRRRRDDEHTEATSMLRNR